MARLPRGDEAEIPREKVVGYLLSTTHPVGRAKAAYFLALGFDVSLPEQFEEALSLHVLRGEVVEHELNPFGEKFVVEGRLEGPTGSAARLRSVWIVPNGQETPRLVTAYPA